jgi:hypothetical protein
MAGKQLGGGPAFEALAAKLVKVPKKELDRRLRQRKQRQAKKKQ